MDALLKKNQNLILLNIQSGNDSEYFPYLRGVFLLLDNHRYSELRGPGSPCGGCAVSPEPLLSEVWEEHRPETWDSEKAQKTPVLKLTEKAQVDSESPEMYFSFWNLFDIFDGLFL